MNDDYKELTFQIGDWSQMIVFYVPRPDNLIDLNIDDYINTIGKRFLAKLDEARIALKEEQEERKKKLAENAPESL